MLIRYNMSNVHALGEIKPPQSGQLPGAPTDVAWLRPGFNEFPSHIWKQYETHPHVLRMLKDKQIELLTFKIKKGKKTETIGMKDEELHLTVLSEDDALSVIKFCFDRDILQRWIDEENRSKVKRALVKQLEPLLPGEKEAS